MKIFLSKILLLTIVLAVPMTNQDPSLVPEAKNQLVVDTETKSPALIEKLPADLLLRVGKSLPLKDYLRFSTCSQILKKSVLYKDYRDMIEFLSMTQNVNGLSLLDNGVAMSIILPSNVPDNLCYLSNYLLITFNNIDWIIKFQERFPKNKAIIIYKPSTFEEKDAQKLTSFLQGGGIIHEFDINYYFTYPELIPYVLQSGARKVFFMIKFEDMVYLDSIGKYVATSSTRQLKELNIHVSERRGVDNNIDEQWSKFFQIIPQFKIEVLNVKHYYSLRNELIVQLAESLPLEIRAFEMVFANLKIERLGSIFEALAVKTNLKHLVLGRIMFDDGEYTLENLRLLPGLETLELRLQNVWEMHSARKLLREIIQFSPLNLEELKISLSFFYRFPRDILELPESILQSKLKKLVVEMKLNVTPVFYTFIQKPDLVQFSSKIETVDLK
ncbi:hypothetical protein ROZALSC1DRAFT_22707, partial [Rozella allomycis CSF55]